MSDRVCIEHGLSVITNPNLHSKGQYKQCGAWLGGKKPSTFQQRLKAQIDLCLAEKPDSFATFLQALSTFELPNSDRNGLPGCGPPHWARLTLRRRSGCQEKPESSTRFLLISEMSVAGTIH